MKGPVGLADFVAAQPRPGRTCWVCSLAECEELDKARSTGAASVSQMVRWLREVKGHASATGAKLNYHFGHQR